MSRRLLAAAILLATALVPVRSTGADAPPRDHVIGVDDYFTLGTIVGLAVSPAGTHVAYVEQRWEPDAEKRNADLWVVDTTTKARRRLSFDRADETAPQWSPDGRFVYFTTGARRPGDDTPPYDGKAQGWRVAADGTGQIGRAHV